VDSTSLQSSLRNLDAAYQNFFNGRGFPKYKCKNTHNFSYTSKCTNGNIAYMGKKIKLPKVGLVKTKNKLVPEGRIISATMLQVPSGKYYVVLLCIDVEPKQLSKTGKNVGIDLGLKDFAIPSEGDAIPNPKFLRRSLDRLARLHKDLSRKKSGGIVTGTRQGLKWQGCMNILQTRGMTSCKSYQHT